MKHITDIFFDLDRTLWDFEQNSVVVLKILYEKFRLDNYITDFDTFLNCYNKTNSTYWKSYGKGEISKEELENGRFTDTLKSFNIESKKTGIEINKQYEKLSPYQTRLFPDTKSVLETLKNNNYNLHIITNGFKKVQLLKIRNSGIEIFFDKIVCSEEIGKNKPHPSVFIESLHQAKTNCKNSIMIGDDFEADVLGAENVGIHGVLFDPQKRYNSTANVDKIETLNEVPELVTKI